MGNRMSVHPFGGHMADNAPSIQSALINTIYMYIHTHYTRQVPRLPARSREEQEEMAALWPMTYHGYVWVPCKHMKAFWAAMLAECERLFGGRWVAELIYIYGLITHTLF
jgi:hypothetical protein